MNFEPLLKFGVDQGASAVHLQAGSPPQLRIGGLIRNVEGAPVGAADLEALLRSIAPSPPDGDLGGWLARGACFSAPVGSVGRFRCTAYGQVAGPGVVLKVIPGAVRSVEELNLPPVVRQVALAPQGLVLVVGPAGSGKSTTLAAMVDAVNGAAYRKVVTIEAPVESLHANKKSLVTQMEVGAHTPSFEHGIGLALQQDADVIVVGDLCDPAAARAALGAAESGRKVLAAVAGLYAIQAVTRLIALIPPADRETAVSQLASSLEGVIAQRLAKTRDGKLRPAVEVLRGGANTVKAIQENRLKDLGYFIEGRQGGMQTLDQHLIELYRSGAVSGTEAMRLASNPEAVGAGLRAPQPAAAARDRAAPDLVGDDPGLAP